ncbi:AAA family ATPase [Candidatus Methylospira mobilis]|uniref:AAA family ATPase n=1 Tax=Candidatus Methylospira mobilis TaxID=1808979 RepID=A0A5Q0BGH7_9GAMM|nr:AAA family ATPase [Candidatus Methylospira mobilis]QFY42955.1 AAA family ATPase [Candidatus Methylospira mobilis]
MKIQSISITDFLAVRSVNISARVPVTVIAGNNEAGKSSIRDAIALALTGELCRVSKKSESHELINHGSTDKRAEICIETNVGTFSASITPRQIKIGVGEYASERLTYLLATSRFARLDTNSRRALLFDLMGVSAKPEFVKTKLLERGCDATKTEIILPMLRSGFDAANKEAAQRARDEKAAWKAITGEVYGEKKADGWQVSKPEFDEAAIVDLEKQIDFINRERLPIAQQTLGALNQSWQQHQDSLQRRAELEQKAGMIERLQRKLGIDQTDLERERALIEDMRGRIKSHTPTMYGCPECGAALYFQVDRLEPYPELPEVENPVTESGIATHEKSYALLESCVNNGKRAIEEAKKAKAQLEEINSTLGDAPAPGQIDAARESAEKLQAEQQEKRRALDALKSAKTAAEQADVNTKKALVAHNSVSDWSKIADALAPDGIPGDMLKAALEPINERLAYSANIAEWKRINIGPDMEIYAAEEGEQPIDYRLLSVSAKWRADAMIAEAISHLSGLKFIVLDGFDVLSLKGREDLFCWLEELALQGEIETAIVLGTLKSAPNLPSRVNQSYWIEGGVIENQKMQEAA